VTIRKGRTEEELIAETTPTPPTVAGSSE
jgi:hypothetical protein